MRIEDVNRSEEMTFMAIRGVVVRSPESGLFRGELFPPVEYAALDLPNLPTAWVQTKAEAETLLHALMQRLCASLSTAGFPSWLTTEGQPDA